MYGLASVLRTRPPVGEEGEEVGDANVVVTVEVGGAAGTALGGTCAAVCRNQQRRTICAISNSRPSIAAKRFSSPAEWRRGQRAAGWTIVSEYRRLPLSPTIGPVGPLWYSVPDYSLLDIGVHRSAGQATHQSRFDSNRLAGRYGCVVETTCRERRDGR